MKTYCTAIVNKACAVATEIREITFTPQLPIELFPGSHITFRIPTGAGDKARSYSVVDFGGASKDFTIAVKLEPISRGGSRFMHGLQAGDQVEIISIGNSLPLTLGAPAYLLIAGGIGITPIIGLASALMHVGSNVSLHYFTRSRAHTAYRETLSALMGDKVVFNFADTDRPIDLPLIFNETSSDTIVYLCGPLGMIEAAKAAWDSLGRPPQNLRYENFGSSGQFPNTNFSVTVAETGAIVNVAQDETLLEALLRTNQKVMFGCQKGECGLCKVAVISESEIDHRDTFLGPHERQSKDYMCACVSRVVSGSATLHLDGISHGPARTPLKLSRDGLK
ncbi:2Fe-2S iron-sulfur cluster-binding protein [Thiopseudomonas alkaliphila]|uniref:PDR/VanB family oxidoreductase n=1 Tax=Thiopseudomonas alkaliphila TaxID=1697053 RepID=UPI0035716EBE